jgi:hypothetical protein
MHRGILTVFESSAHDLTDRRRDQLRAMADELEEQGHDVQTVARILAGDLRSAPPDRWSPGTFMADVLPRALRNAAARDVGEQIGSETPIPDAISHKAATQSLFQGHIRKQLPDARFDEHFERVGTDTPCRWSPSTEIAREAARQHFSTS